MNKPYETGLCVAIIAGVFCPTLVTFAQNPSSAPQTSDQAGVTIVRVIVTGSFSASSPPGPCGRRSSSTGACSSCRP